MNQRLQRCTLMVLLGAWLNAFGMAAAQNWFKTSAPEMAWQSVATSADGSKLVVAGQWLTPGWIYVSVDSGATWTKTAAPLTNWAAVACSTNGITMAAVAGGNCAVGPIYVSTDSGLNWTCTQAPVTGWVGLACSADGKILVAAAILDGLYISTNSGTTWGKLDAPSTEWCSVACSDDARTIVACGLGIYISTNFGVNWQASSAAQGPWGSLACSADGRFLMSSTPGSYPPFREGLYCSYDGGDSWKVYREWTATALACSWDGTCLAVSTGSGLSLHSTNAGASWTACQAKRWDALAATPDGSRFVGAGSDGVYIWQAPTILSISASAKNSVIRWPAVASSTGLRLQHKLELTSTNWSDVNGPPVLTNGCYQVTLPTSSQAFYRLTWP